MTGHRSTDDRLDELESGQREILRLLKGRQRRAGKRAGTVARRVIAAVEREHMPSDLVREQAKRILRRRGTAA